MTSLHSLRSSLRSNAEDVHKWPPEVAEAFRGLSEVVDHHARYDLLDPNHVCGCGFAMYRLPDGSLACAEC